MRNQVELRPVESRSEMRRTLDDAIIKLNSERDKLKQAIINGAPIEARDAYRELLYGIINLSMLRMEKCL